MHASLSVLPVACEPPNVEASRVPEQTILTVDVGGSHVKLLLSRGDEERRRFESGPTLRPQEMVEGVLALASDWSYDAISVGVPAPVARRPRRHRPGEPRPRLGGVRVRGSVRQADEGVQRRGDAGARELRRRQDAVPRLRYRPRLLACRRGGRGAAGAGPSTFRKATYEDYVGERGRKRLGGKKWRETVFETIEEFSAALEPDYIVLGGGNAKKLGALPENVKLGANENAFLGGFRLWIRRSRRKP